jgi:hypothetical protein
MKKIMASLQQSTQGGECTDDNDKYPAIEKSGAPKGTILELFSPVSSRI